MVHLDPVYLAARKMCSSILSGMSVHRSARFSIGNVTESKNRLDRLVGAMKFEQHMWAEIFFFGLFFNLNVNLKRPPPKEVSSRANTNSVGCAVISQLISTWQEGRQEALDSSAERMESIQDSFSVSFVDLETENFSSALTASDIRQIWPWLGQRRACRDERQRN